MKFKIILILLFLSKALFSQESEWQTYKDRRGHKTKNLKCLKVDERNTFYIMKKTYEDLKANKTKTGPYIMPVISIEKGELKHITAPGLDIHIHKQEEILGRLQLCFFLQGEIIPIKKYTFASKDKPNLEPVIIDFAPPNEYLDYTKVCSSMVKLAILGLPLFIYYSPANTLEGIFRSPPPQNKGGLIVTMEGLAPEEIYTITITSEEADAMSALAFTYNRFAEKDLFRRKTTEPYQE